MRVGDYSLIFGVVTVHDRDNPANPAGDVINTVLGLVGRKKTAAS